MPKGVFKHKPKTTEQKLKLSKTLKRLFKEGVWKPGKVGGWNRGKKSAWVSKMNKERKGTRYKEWIKKECPFCKKTYEVRPNLGEVRKFCSRECAAKWQMEKRNWNGKNHPNWQGGLTPVNYKIRNSKKYKDWRKEVFSRDNFTCQMCNKKGGDLEADHIKQFSKYPKLRFELSNGRTLCKPCHNKVTWRY